MGLLLRAEQEKSKIPTIIVRCNSTEAKKIMNSDNTIFAITDAIIEGKIIDARSSSPMFSAMIKVLELMKLIKSKR